MTIKEAIRERHSVRQYKNIAIKAEDRERLEALIKECNAESGLHLQLICDEPECFDTLFAHYGKFTNAKNYIAIVGPKSKDDLDELGGYYGERIVLEAQMLGLNTCWVAGSYGKGKCKAAVAEDEKLVCVISIGYGEKTGSAHKSKSVDKLCNVPESARPDWFKEGLEAALLAPTAINQQRFLISLEGDTPVITAKLGPMTKIDLGIVKYNFEAASGHKCK
ncbi:MAG: nitroreductase [Lachnospiraceae bacterium]|nr:nitroreductase [Lachnospiraceae bacterium]